MESDRLRWHGIKWDKMGIIKIQYLVSLGVIELSRRVGHEAFGEEDDEVDSEAPLLRILSFTVIVQYMIETLFLTDRQQLSCLGRYFVVLRRGTDNQLICTLKIGIL